MLARACGFPRANARFCHRASASSSRASRARARVGVAVSARVVANDRERRASFDADDASRDGARATRRRSNERPRRRAVARAASGTDDEPPAPLYVKIPLGFAYAALTYLPWCLKVFFGLQSDLVPVFGTHRRFYYALGWVVFFLCNCELWREGEPGIASTLLLSFVMTMGCLMSDTVADAIILECTTAGEAEADTGRMRTHGYLVRQVGSTLGSLGGAVIYLSLIHI